MLEREPRELLDEPRIGELDARLLNLTAPLAEHLGHHVGDPARLLRMGVVDDQDRGLGG